MLLLTGSTGFIGNALLNRLAEAGDIKIRACARKKDTDFPPTVEKFPIPTVSDKTDWKDALQEIDVVLHTIARVHIMKDKSKDPLAAFRAVNVDATLNLARQAAQCGVKRFVFVSSVKVNGETTLGKPFSCNDIPVPSDPYGISKLEAEQGLFALSEETGMEIVIVRPPLVYGPGVGANFLRLMQLVKMGIPLPFAAIHNRRSMVALDNLVDLLILCTHHQAASGQIFMVSDDYDVSTSELLRMLADAMGKRIWLLPVPPSFIADTAAMFGKSAVADRLLGSLQIDIGHTKLLLGWKPVIGVQNALQKTVAHFLAQHKKVFCEENF